MAIDPIGARGLLPASGQVAESGGERFADALTKMLRDVNHDQVEAAQKAEDLLVSGKGSIHDAMLAMSRAEGSFRLLMEMRNRLVDGLNRLLQAQV